MPVARKVGGKLKSWVDKVLQDRITERHARNELILGFRKQRFMRLKARPPEAYQDYIGDGGVKVPLSYRLIETVIGSAAAERPDFHVSSPDREVARRVGKWAKLVLQNQEVVSQPALYWKYWDGLFADGIVAMKTQRRPWTDFPRPVEGEDDAAYNARVEEFLRVAPPVPWRTRVVDGSTFIPPNYDFGRDFAIESGLRPSMDTLQLLGLTVTPRGSVVPIEVKDEPLPRMMPNNKLGPTIQVDELWMDDTLYVRVNGNVFEYDNELGRIPYVWTTGSSIPFNDPTLEAMSVLMPLMHLEPWVNQFLTTLVAQATAAGTATPVITHQAQGTLAGNGEAQISEFRAGRLHNMPPGSSLAFIAPPLPGESITLFQTMVSLAERFTLSPTPDFAGTRTPGVVLSAVAERTLAVLKPRIDQAVKTWSDQVKFWLELVKTINSPVAVSGMLFEEKDGRSRMAETVITPRDVAKVSDVVTDIQFQTIQDRIAWDTHNVMMQQSGIWSMERSRRESGVDDPVSEADDVFLEQLEQNPTIQLYLQQRALEGQPVLEALSDLIQQASEGSDVPGPAAPGQPGSSGTGGTGPQGGRVAGQPRAAGGQRALAPGQAQATVQ